MNLATFQLSLSFLFHLGFVALFCLDPAPLKHRVMLCRNLKRFDYELIHNLLLKKSY